MRRIDINILGRRRFRPGFTLIELTMVFITIAALSAMAVPKWVAANQRYRADLTARRISADLSTARSRAMYSSASITVTFTVNTSSYQVTGMNDPDHPGSAWSVLLNSPPYRASITSATLGNGTQVSFDGYGTPSNGGTIVINTGGVTRTITLDGTAGTVTWQ